MARILILEGNTPTLLEARTARGELWTAEAYGEALRFYEPGLEIVVGRPYFPDYDPELPLDEVDAMVVTGSGVSWSAAEEKARPFWQAYERCFAAGKPALGSCWGVQTAAVALGGDSAAGPNGVEAGVARAVCLTEAGLAHPLHAGRPARFDVLCMHRDDVTRLPEGAVVTATNAHTAVQGMVYEAGGVRFWGVQYHPEITLGDVAFYHTRSVAAFAEEEPGRAVIAADYDRIAKDPAGTADLQARYGIGAELLDFATHAVELGNWLEHCVLGRAPVTARMAGTSMETAR